MRGGQLADASGPTRKSGTQTPRLHQPEQRHLTANSAGWVNAVWSSDRRIRPRHSTSRSGRSRCRSSSAHTASSASANTGNASYSSTAHPEPLAALAREQERHPATGHRAARRARGHRAPRQGRQTRRQAVPRSPADHHRPVLQGRAAGGQGVAPRRRAQLGVAVSTWAQQPRGLGPQRRRRRGPRRTHGRTRQGPSPERPRRRSPSAGRLLQDHVRVGAADAERRHARPARAAVGLRPGAGPRSAARPRPPTSRRAGDGSSTCSVCGSTPCRIAMTILMTPATPAAAWVWPMLDFIEPSHSGRPSGRLLAVGGEQRLRLDRVAQRRAGAVRLDRVDVGGRQPGVGQRLADDALLGGAVRRRQTVARAVLVDGGAAHHGEHLVAVARGRPTAAPAAACPTPSAQPVPSASPRTPCSGRRRPGRAAG